MIKQCKISLIIGATLIASAFIPIIHIILLTINGGLLSLITTGNNNKTIFIVNALGSILFYILYFYSNNPIVKIFNSIGFLFFILPFISYTTENLIPKEPYYLSILFVSFVASILLVIIDIIKWKLFK